jgi:uncharacterized protein YndB with AHSA1/START domain
MTLTNLVKDPERLTMTVTAEFDAPVERVWQLWGDPRRLERWWGPPTYPATVVDHDLVQGGRVTYLMTGPTGDTPKGLWDVVEVEAPRRLVVEDAFATDDWVAMPGMPRTVMTVELAERDGGGTVVTMTSLFPSAEALEQMLAMQMEEGLRQAVAQMDDVLAA